MTLSTISLLAYAAVPPALALTLLLALPRLRRASTPARAAILALLALCLLTASLLLAACVLPARPRPGAAALRLAMPCTLLVLGAAVLAKASALARVHAHPAARPVLTCLLAMLAAQTATNMTAVVLVLAECRPVGSWGSGACRPAEIRASALRTAWGVAVGVDVVFWGCVVWAVGRAKGVSGRIVGELCGGAVLTVVFGCLRLAKPHNFQVPLLTSVLHLCCTTILLVLLPRLPMALSPLNLAEQSMACSRTELVIPAHPPTLPHPAPRTISSPTPPPTASSSSSPSSSPSSSSSSSDSTHFSSCASSLESLTLQKTTSNATATATAAANTPRLRWDVVAEFSIVVEANPAPLPTAAKQHNTQSGILRTTELDVKEERREDLDKQHL